MICIPEIAQIGPQENNEKKLNKYEKISYFTIPDRKDMIKLSCYMNDKRPINTDWQNTTTPIKALASDNCNVSLLTGLKNDITVVDADTHKMCPDNIFLITFAEELKTFFNTFTVRSASGGLHFYFNYDSAVKQTQGRNEVDIRNDGGHIMCPPSKVNGGTYVVINDVPTIQIPKKLKDWCLENRKKTKKEPKIKKEKNILDITEPEIQTTYDVDLTDQEFTDILSKLPVDIKTKKDDFRGDYGKWIEILKACKFLGRKNEFIEWSKKTIHENYDEHKLLSFWRDEDACIWNFIYLLKNAKVKNRYTFKRLPIDAFTNYKEINKAKLDDIDQVTKKVTKNFFNPGKNYLVKSDTGTGKTTSFKNYVITNKRKFISITSRVSLSYEQCDSFREQGIIVEHYKDQSYEFGDNIIITPESSLAIKNFDFSKYTLFLDEFDSIINHILKSDTLKNKRVEVFRNLLCMIVSCEQFIAVDADISSISKRLLDFLKLDYDFYINQFKNYNNVKVHVIYDEKEFFEHVRSKLKYLLCSDSKTDTELAALRLQVDQLDLKIFTSDSADERIRLDDWDRALFSPKILYGLDSLMRRTVFCHYKGHTISPSQMVQQLCRCRDIVEVYVYFSDIDSKTPIFNVPEDTNTYFNNLVKNYNQRLDAIYDADDESDAIKLFDERISDKHVNELFNELFKMNAYKEDCYGTNKFLHFLNILKNKGLTIEMERPTQLKHVNNKELRIELLENKLEQFNPDSLKTTKLNEYLHIPHVELDKYKELFVDNNLLQNHFNVSSFFFADQTDNLVKLSSRLDFDISKCKDMKLKLNLLTEMIQKLKIDKLRLNSFIPKGTKLKNTDELTLKYRQLFRVRKEKLDIDVDTGMYKEICNIYRSLFGVTTFKRVKFSKKYNINISSVDDELMAIHKTIYDFRKKQQKPIKVNLFNNVHKPNEETFDDIIEINTSIDRKVSCQQQLFYKICSDIEKLI